MTRTIQSLELTPADSPYTLVEASAYKPSEGLANDPGLWLEFSNDAWTLNDNNGAEPIESTEDLDRITADWLKAVQA